MKKLICAVAVLCALTSCKFVKVGGKPLSSVLGDLDVTAETIKASDNVITKTIDVEIFDGIVCNVPCDLIYTPGQTGLKIKGPDNVIENLDILCENGRLNIKYGKYRFRDLDELDVYVSSEVLRSLHINGAAEFRATAFNATDSFEAEVNGAADMEIRGLAAETATINVNGAAEAEISGLDCDFIEVVINGAGDCTLSGKARKADLSINGAGDIDITGLTYDKLDSAVHGIGDISGKKK